MASKYIKRFSIVLATEDMQIKSTVPYQHRHTRMTNIKNLKWGCRASRTLALFWWDHKLVKQLQKTIEWYVLKLSANPRSISTLIQIQQTEDVCSQKTM